MPAPPNHIKMDNLDFDFMQFYNLISKKTQDLAHCAACDKNIHLDARSIRFHIHTSEHLNKLNDCFELNIAQNKPVPQIILDLKYFKIHRIIVIEVNNLYCLICSEKITISGDINEINLLTTAANDHIKTFPKHIDYMVKILHDLFDRSVQLSNCTTMINPQMRSKYSMPIDPNMWSNSLPPRDQCDTWTKKKEHGNEYNFTGLLIQPPVVQAAPLIRSIFQDNPRVITDPLPLADININGLNNNKDEINIGFENGMEQMIFNSVGKLIDIDDGSDKPNINASWHPLLGTNIKLKNTDNVYIKPMVSTVELDTTVKPQINNNCQNGATDQICESSTSTGKEQNIKKYNHRKDILKFDEIFKEGFDFTTAKNDPDKKEHYREFVNLLSNNQIVQVGSEKMCNACGRNFPYKSLKDHLLSNEHYDKIEDIYCDENTLSVADLKCQNENRTLAEIFNIKPMPPTNSDQSNKNPEINLRVMFDMLSEYWIDRMANSEQELETIENGNHELAVESYCTSHMLKSYIAQLRLKFEKWLNRSNLSEQSQPSDDSDDLYDEIPTVKPTDNISVLKPLENKPAVKLPENDFHKIFTGLKLESEKIVLEASVAEFFQGVYKPPSGADLQPLQQSSVQTRSFEESSENFEFDNILAKHKIVFIGGTLYTCQICSANINSEQNCLEHIKGKNHMLKMMSKTNMNCSIGVTNLTKRPRNISFQDERMKETTQNKTKYKQLPFTPPPSSIQEKNPTANRKETVQPSRKKANAPLPEEKSDSQKRPTLLITHCIFPMANNNFRCDVCSTPTTNLILGSISDVVGHIVSEKHRANLNKT